MSLSYSGSLPRSSVTSYQGRKVCWNISSQGTSGSAPDLAGDFQRQSGSPAHNGQPDVWVNPMTDPTNAVSSDQAPSTSMLLNSPLQRDGQPLIIISGHGAHDEIQSRTFTNLFQMLHAWAEQKCRWKIAFIFWVFFWERNLSIDYITRQESLCTHLISNSQQEHKKRKSGQVVSTSRTSRVVPAEAVAAVSHLQEGPTDFPIPSTGSWRFANWAKGKHPLPTSGQFSRLYL